MKKILAAALLLILAACGGGGHTPQPPGPGPQPNPRPGHIVMSADWTKPELGGIALECGGSVPFKCNLPPGVEWGVLPHAPQPGGGVICTYPLPNTCFQQTSDELGYKVSPGGMALISAVSIPKDYAMSIEAVVTWDTLSCPGNGYLGPVIYDGEGAKDDPTGNYRSIYLSCAPWETEVRVWVYGPTYAGRLSDRTFGPGTHTLGMTWVPGVSITYEVDHVPVFVETPGFSADGLTFTKDPHPALWFGDSAGRIGRFDMTSTAP